MASTKKVVYAALVANFLIAVAKFGAWTVTGSSSMLSEAYHSVSDTGNQVLLLLGIRMSEKGTSPEYPFGRGKEQYFYAFVVSVILFGIAGYSSLTEGIHRLGESYHESEVLINYVLLGLALVFEAYSLKNAYDGFRKEMEEKGYDSFWTAYTNSKDAALITALTEDTLAILGILVAIAGVYLTEVTQNVFYDAASSILIGLLLMGFAAVLAWENRGLIVGEGVTPSERDEILGAIETHDDVVGVADLRTMYLGADEVLVAVEVEFRDSMETSEIETAVDEVESLIRDCVPAADRIYVEAGGLTKY
ncbi:MAG: cation diffusion facilitator family transporter [Halobacteria archaeon]|nr:cation diffusion facilitator family transporter [Halobacteria archaeon]